MLRFIVELCGLKQIIQKISYTLEKSHTMYEIFWRCMRFFAKLEPSGRYTVRALSPRTVSIREFNYMTIFSNSIRRAVHSRFLCDEMYKNLIHPIKISYICMRFFQMYEIFRCFSPHEFPANSATNRNAKNRHTIEFPYGFGARR